MTMNNDEDYRKILSFFRVNDLKVLLGAFGQNKVGRRAELRERAHELLISRPTGLDYAAYQSKINEIYRLLPCNKPHISNNMMQTQQGQNASTSQVQTPQQRMHQLPQTHQQSMHMPQVRLPHRNNNTKMEGGINGNPVGANTIPGNTMANNHIQYVSGSYQPVRPQIIVSSPMPASQQNMNGMIQNTLKLVLNTSNGRDNNALIPSLRLLANLKFKKIPFYEVIEDIIQPTLLDGPEKCVTIVKGMRECTFEHIMSGEQASLIAKNRDISYGKIQYDFQYQIRLCQLERGSLHEVTDYFPIGLRIQVGKSNCISPDPSQLRTGKFFRKAAEPINIAQFLKLSPFVKNVITVNWLPDGKNYVLAMFIVKQISVDNLIEKLLETKVRSSEETKNDIIKNLTNIDPDLTTTSSYKFSLVCPLSKVRMQIPAKSIHCDHIQCFDVSTFILMNKKKSKWMCPMCNKSSLYDNLRIDNYFLEILTSHTLPDDINEIEVLADGSWIIPEKNKDTKDMNSTIDDKVKPLDLVDLDDSDDEKFKEMKKESKPGVSVCQESESLKQHLVDLTMDEDEEPSN